MIQSNFINHIRCVKISSGKGNFITSSDVDILFNILCEDAKNEEVVGLILCGERHCFCTGLKIDKSSSEEIESLFSKFDHFLFKFFSFPKPIVVAIDGHSIGGGLLLQCCADYIVASDNNMAKIGLPELKFGLTIDELMISLLNYNLNNSRELQNLLYNGEYVTIQRAKEIGLIDKVVDSSMLEEEAQQALFKLKSYNPKAFEITKLKLRKDTLKSMQASLDNKCYKVFNELMKL